MTVAGFSRPLQRGAWCGLGTALVLAGGWCQAQDAAQWPRWRGPLDNGSVATGTYPVHWDSSQVLWKADLPGKGCSTPIVWDQHIYLTAPADGRDAVLAFDWSGRPRWQTALGASQAGTRGNSSGANPSPATDGRGLFVCYKSGTLAALELDGRVRWQTNLVAAFGPETLFWDRGGSPVPTEESVILARMHHGDSWLAAFDKTDGRLRWKVSRNYPTALEGDNSYTTPLRFRHQGQEAILTWGGEHVTAHAAADGRLLWSCGGFNPQGSEYWPSVASPLLVDDLVVIPTGRADRGQPRLHGIRLGGAGEVTATHRVWKREDCGTFVPTPAEYEHRLYLVRDHGEVDCLEPATGRTLWQAALPKGNYYASPLVAAGKLYAARDDGLVCVAAVQDHFELLAQNPMGEPIIASPIAVANRLLLRGDKHLFCVAGP